MRYTIMSLFRDLESDAVYTSFDRNTDDVGYSLVDASSIVMQKSILATHDEAVMEITGGKGIGEAAYLQVEVRDDTHLQRWSVIGP